MHDVDALSRRLAALDAMYSGWIPGFREAHGARLESLQAARARQGLDFVPGLRASLPSSVLRRALVIESLTPSRVVLLGDADALASALSSSITVSVSDPNAGHTSVIADVAVLEVGDHAMTVRRLESAIAAVGNAGIIVARVRWPWDRAFYEHVRVMGLKLIGYERDIDHTLLPGAHVVDGGGDLVILGGAVAATAPALPVASSENLSQRLPVSPDVPPYAWFDMDGIAPARSKDVSLEAWAAEVSRLSQRQPDFVDIQKHQDHEVLAWYDARGFGFVAELERDASHVLVTYVPYDDALDHSVLTAAFGLFADDDTRVRPRRTERTPDRPVFA